MIDNKEIELNRATFLESGRRWMLYPEKFIAEVMGIHGLTDQQLEGCAEVGKIVRAKALAWAGRDNPAALEALKAEGLEEHAKLFGITIRAGKGTGKDALVSMLIQWFLCMFDNSKVVCIGPNERSLKTVLWQEVARWHSNQKDGEYTFKMRDCIKIEAEKIYRNDIPDPGRRWFAFPIVAPIRSDTRRQASALSGQHADHMLIIADEAAGINDEHFAPLEDTMTGKINFAILISQMTRSNGFFYDSHFGNGKDRWVRLHWSSLDSPLVNKDLVENIKEKYGEFSNQYRVNVLGEPPTAESDSLIEWEWVAQAKIRSVPEEVYEQYDVVVGTDIGLHADRTICCIRQGPKVHEFYPIVSSDHSQIAMSIVRIAKEWQARHICMDNHVIGDAVFQMCKKMLSGMAIQLHGVKGNWAPRSGRDADRFYNLRAQLWWRVREAFKEGEICLPDDEAVTNQLLALKLVTGTGSAKKILIIDKVKLRKILGESPDHADALCYTYFVEDSVLMKRKILDYEDEEIEEATPSWMRA